MKEQHSKLKDLVRKALKNWHLPSVTSPDIFTELLSIQALANEEVDLRAPESVRTAINQALADAIDALAVLERDNPVGSTILRSRFLDKLPTAKVALQIKENEHFVNRAQAKAIEQVAAFLWAREESYRQERIQDMVSRLKASKYDLLIGREQEQQHLAQMLLSDESDWLILLIGMGGTGKTALADYVIRSVVSSFVFHDVVQVSVDSHPMDRREGHDPQRTYEILLAKIYAQLDSHSPGATVADQERFVQQALNERRYLLVIDNVEEAGDATLLAEKFGAWVMPSKVLIVSRVRPKTGSFRAFPLPDLSETNAIALMRHEAAKLNLDSMANEPEDALRLIFEYTGGNPYAIKIVIGMLRIWSLPQTIAAIQRGQAQRIERMFDHIFRAAWKTLTDSAQEVLLSMPLFGTAGASAEELIDLTGLPVDDVLNAIEQLSYQSLIEVSGGMSERTYGVHRLTETFLQQIIYGGSSDNDSEPDGSDDDDGETPGEDTA